MKKFRLKLCPLKTYLFVTVIRIELQQYDMMAMVASLDALAAMLKRCLEVQKGWGCCSSKPSSKNSSRQRAQIEEEDQLIYDERADCIGVKGLLQGV